MSGRERGPVCHPEHSEGSLPTASQILRCEKSDRDGPLYHAVYDQRTSTERINSQSKELGIKRPKVRNIDSIRNLNTLTYLVINARALRRVRELNASLLSMPMKMIA